MNNAKLVLEFNLINVLHVNQIALYKLIIHVNVMMDTIYIIMIVCFVILIV